MKNSSLLMAILLVTMLTYSNLLSCNSIYNKTDYFLEVDSIVVSYLDWDLRTRGALTCEDVKNYNGGKNAKYVITDKAVIQKFVKALSLVEFSFIMSKEKSDIRMVLDFYGSNELRKEICLNYNRGIFIEGNLYSNKALFFLIEDEIPKTTAPHALEEIRKKNE